MSKNNAAPAAEVLEHEIGNTVLVPPVIDVKDVAMIAARAARLRLCLELAEKGRVACRSRVQEVLGDAWAKGPRVVGREDLGGSPGADNGK